MNIASINNLNIEKKSYGLVNLLSGNKKEEVSKDDGVGGLLLELQKERIKTEEIAKKIVRGEAVNSEDLQYIKDKNPSLLDKASEFKNERKVLEGKIRSAKSRKEAIDILNREKSSKMNLLINEGNLGAVLKLHEENIKQIEKNTNIDLKKDKEDKKSINKLA